ncbi:MAG: methyltransferase [Anaerolineales bacterium]
MSSDNPQTNRPPEAIIFQMLDGFKITQAIHAASRLAIFDALAEKTLTASELAASVGAHAPSLLRLLRFLTTIDILAEDDRQRFAATAMGQYLRSDHPLSMRPWADMFGSPTFWRSWGDLYETILTGQPAFDRNYGQGHFDFLSRHPDEAAVFNAAMTRGTARSLPAILEAYDFTPYQKIVDVAGGHGALLRGILERAPRAAGVLYEMPAVAAEARALRGSPVEARCEFVVGSMFESIPAGGDLYVMKQIIHDWDDDAAIRILRNTRQAMGPEGRLLVVDRIVLPPNQPDPAKSTDLMMLVMLTGRERTEAEFSALYQAAGFRLTRVIPAGEFSLVEGVPI